jgi:hypothetical protein
MSDKVHEVVEEMLDKDIWAASGDHRCLIVSAICAGISAHAAERHQGPNYKAAKRLIIKFSQGQGTVSSFLPMNCGYMEQILDALASPAPSGAESTESVPNIVTMKETISLASEQRPHLMQPNPGTGAEHSTWHKRNPECEGLDCIATAPVAVEPKEYAVRVEIVSSSECGLRSAE